MMSKMRKANGSDMHINALKEITRLKMVLLENL